MPNETPEQLFEGHLKWAERIGRSVARSMPTAFDVQDLVQEARIEHWKRCQSYDPASGVPYEGYAFQAVRGAVLMYCRRRNWKESMHHELDTLGDYETGHKMGKNRKRHGMGDWYFDKKPLADAEIISAEDAEIEAPKVEMAIKAVYARMVQLSPVERYLVQTIYFDGTDVAEVARKWGSGSRPAIARRLMKAVGKLRRAE